MNSNKRTARVAGLLYLVVVLTGIFNLAYVPSKLIVWNDAAITFKNIEASETMFRVGVVSGLVCYMAFLFLPIVLYKLLKPVNEVCAMFMVLLAVVSVPVSFLNIRHQFDVLELVGNAGYLSVFRSEELHAQVLFYLHSYSSGNKIVSIFWGLWLLPFGWLVFKSGFLPKALGVLLMIGCFGYLVHFIAGFLFPNYGETFIASIITKPGSIGEIGICLWLMIVGIRNKNRTRKAT